MKTEERNMQDHVWLDGKPLHLEGRAGKRGSAALIFAAGVATAYLSLTALRFGLYWLGAP